MAGAPKVRGSGDTGAIRFPCPPNGPTVTALRYRSLTGAPDEVSNGVKSFLGLWGAPGSGGSCPRGGASAKKSIGLRARGHSSAQNGYREAVHGRGHGGCRGGGVGGGTSGWRDFRGCCVVDDDQ